MTNKGYEINFADKKIIITKKFSKAAGIYDSDEYKILCGLRKDFPDFSVTAKTIEKNKNKTSYKGLTIDEMKRFMLKRPQNEQEQFEKVIELKNDKKCQYASIKKWFLYMYKDEFRFEIEELLLAAQNKADNENNNAA